MVISNYTTTALEDWVTNFYIRNRIYNPEDIDLKTIAYRHNIFINKKCMPARYDIIGRYKGIIIDARCSIEEQREQFFHEFAHILRHSGHQSMMPKAFRELQEWDAVHFTLYAALPFHMIKKYDLSDPYLISQLAYDFKVSEELCEERMNKIMRRQLVLV